MSSPTPFEQLLFEFTNQARMDPIGEFSRFIISTSPLQSFDSNITSAINYFNVDPSLYLQQLQALSPAAPLAWNDSLATAAEDHSQRMITQDAQSHQLPGEAGLGARISAAGYDNWSRAAENIYAYSKSAAYAHAGFFIDWGFGPGGMQTPAGHRNNIMNADLQEIGIGAIEETNGATQVGPYVVTQDFGNRWDYQPQVLGVVFDDIDNNDFYSIGEGAGGVTVTLTPAAGPTESVTTQTAGGYTIEAPAGQNLVTFSGGGLPSSVTVEIAFAADNVKVDLVGDTLVQTSADATLREGARDLQLLGAFDTDGTGNDLANHLEGNSGNNELAGADGQDTLVGGDGDDKLRGNAGSDRLFGDDGDDRLYGGKGDDQMFLGHGADYAKGNTGADLVYGGQGNDRLYGKRDEDSLYGEAGDDTLSGGSGRDTLSGGAGDDYLKGGSYGDRLIGGPGDDTLIGGTGKNLFVFDSGSDADRIEGFRAGSGTEDVLDFTLLEIGFADLNIAPEDNNTLITTPAGDSVLLVDVMPFELDAVDDFLI